VKEVEAWKETIHKKMTKLKKHQRKNLKLLKNLDENRNSNLKLRSKH